MSPTFAVQLAQTPADALEVLVDHGGTLNASDIGDAIEHPATGIATRNALALLRDIGCATQTFDDHSVSHWTATNDGRRLIARARRQAHEAGLDDHAPGQKQGPADA